jgi:hypothetical protein
MPRANLTFRQRIERGFHDFALLIYRRRWLTLVLMLLLVGALASQLPKIKMDTSTEGFFRADDPALIAYNHFREQFGREEFVAAAIKPPQVFDLAFLEKLRAFHQDLEKEVPHLDEVTSLINARNTRGEENRLVVEDLFERWPQNADELNAIKARALANPIYRNMLLSADGTFTAVVVSTAKSGAPVSAEEALAGFDEPASIKDKDPQRGFLSDQENSEVVAAVRKVVERYQSADFPIALAGSPVIVDQLKRSMQQDMQKFTRMALLTIAVCLFLMFRRVSGVLLPLAVVIVSLLSTLGLMGLTGTPFKLPTQILPSFILAVCVGAAVHVMAIFYRKLHDVNDTREAIAHAMGHSGLAIVMTSLTTAAGLLSFVTADVAPIADMGVFAASGVMLSLVYTVVLLPALIAVIPLKRKESAAEDARHRRLDRLLERIADFSTTHYKGIIVASLALIALAGIGVAQLRFYHNPLVWFPEQHPIRVATELIDRELKGTTTVEVVIDTGRENGLYEPELLNKLDALAQAVTRLPHPQAPSEKTLSAADVLKEINRALNEDRAEAYAIPQNRDLVAQEFLLFENSGSDDLKDVVDSKFSKLRFTIRVPWVDAGANAQYIADVDKLVRDTLGVDAKFESTGMTALFSRIMHATMVSTAESYLFAAVVITLLMMLLIGSFRIGLVAMLPNIGPIVLTLGLMGFLGLPLDMFTMLIGSISLGLVVDDTIHFMHNFRRYHHHFNDVPQAVRETLRTTGRAMFVTSVVLSIGFFTFMFASMNNVFNFGLLTGITIITALIADFVLSPALVMWITRKPRGANELMDEAAAA